MLEAAVQLDRELAKVLGHVDLLRVSPSAETIDSLVALRPTVISAMREVRERALAIADELALDRAERTLRARAEIVLLQLEELYATESEVDPESLENAGTFRSARDLGRYVDERLARVNANLQRERRELDATASDDRLRDALYYVAVDNAEYGYVAIGKERDVGEFLRAGVASRSKRYRIACGTIAVALDLQIFQDLPGLSGSRRKSTQPAPPMVDTRLRGGHA